MGLRLRSPVSRPRDRKAQGAVGAAVGHSGRGFQRVVNAPRRHGYRRPHSRSSLSVPFPSNPIVSHAGSPAASAKGRPRRASRFRKTPVRRPERGPSRPGHGRRPAKPSCPAERDAKATSGAWLLCSPPGTRREAGLAAASPGLRSGVCAAVPTRKKLGEARMMLGLLRDGFRSDSETTAEKKEAICP